METNFFFVEFQDSQELSLHLKGAMEALRNYQVEIGKTCEVLGRAESRYSGIDLTLPKPVRKQAEKVASNLKQIRRSLETSGEGCKVLAAEIEKAMSFLH